MKDELDGQRVEEMVVDSSTVRGIPPLVPETIDGGANYTDGVLPLGVVSGGPVVSSVSGEAKGQKAPGPDNTYQGTLFHSDQAVAETVVTSAEKVVVGEETPESVVRTVRVRKTTPDQVVGDEAILNGAPAVSEASAHDALR
jgi:hypothetical protein